MTQPARSAVDAKGVAARIGAAVPAGLIGGAMLFAPAPAMAASALERIMPRLERAIAEQRVFLICASLDKAWAADTRETWDEVRGTGRAWLKANGAGADDLTRFEAMTAPERLLVDMPLFQAIELCTVTHPDWVERFTGFRFIAKIDGTPPPAD